MQTAPQVTDQAVQGVLQRVDALAAKLGVTAQYIYGVYVQQARVEAIRDAIFALFFVSISACLGYLGFRLFKYGIASKGYDDWPYICGGLAVTASVVLFGLSFIPFYAAVGEWLNPQYWAFQHLTLDIKGLL